MYNVRRNHLSTGNSVRLYDHAKDALDRRKPSGHTGWSAAWQAALWARLWRGRDAWVSIKRLLTRYTTDRYLTVHPKLNKKGGPNTAYNEDVGAGPLNSNIPNRKRQMVAANGGMVSYYIVLRHACCILSDDNNMFAIVPV